MVTPWAFGHFLLRSQGIFALPVGKDSTQRSVQFSGAGSVYLRGSQSVMRQLPTYFQTTCLRLGGPIVCKLQHTFRKRRL